MWAQAAPPEVRIRARTHAQLRMHSVCIAPVQAEHFSFSASMMASFRATDRAAKRAADEAAAQQAEAEVGCGASTKQLGSTGGSERLHRGSSESVSGLSRRGTGESLAGSVTSLSAARPRLGNAHEFAQPFFSEGGVNYAAQQAPHGSIGR